MTTYAVARTVQVVRLVPALVLILACGSAEEQPVIEECSPYSGARGTSEGEVLEPLQFFRCDGEPVQLDSLACDARIHLLTDYCGWCPISIVHTAYAPELARVYGPFGLGVVVVVSSGLNGSLPTAALCNEVAEQLGPSVTVLFDPYGHWHESISPESDTWFVLEAPGLDTLALRILGRATKPDFETWLLPALEELGDVEVPSPRDVAATVLAEPLCHDLLALGIGTLTSSFQSMPSGELSSVGDHFCACAVGGHEQTFMDAWLGSKDYSSLFDGLEKGASSFHETLDYESARDAFLAPCAAELHLEPLDLALFGRPSSDPAGCVDDDGNDPTRARVAKGRRFSPDLLLSLAFDRARNSAFAIQEELIVSADLYDPSDDSVLVLSDRCMNGTRLREARCVDGELTVSYVSCDGSCDSGRCVGGGSHGGQRDHKD